MKRREFIQYAGLSAAALGFAGPFFNRRLGAASAATVQVDLSITQGFDDMIDGTPVFVWAYLDAAAADRPDGSRLTWAPGPVIQALEGDSLRIAVSNALNEDHGFAISGVVDSGPVAPGATAQLDFPAPPAGTYLYQDPIDSPVGRVLGLHGALVVHPRFGDTPYGAPTEQVLKLFGDLGTSERFPGQPWAKEHQLLWLFHGIDPRWNQQAEQAFRANRATVIDPLQFTQEFLPSYFTLNGRSGCTSAHAADTAPSGKIGEPLLIRAVNAGLAVQSPHIHGNHVYVLARNSSVSSDVLEKDTFLMRPEERVDVLLPFIRPPDIPDAAWPPREEFAADTFAGPPEQRGILHFPMHAHNELSQTAAGGNYPQGMLTDWTIDIRVELGL